MPANTRTTTQLLEGLRDPADGPSWARFVSLYQPILHGFARVSGCTEEDAWDLTQETMARFLPAWRAGRYERGKGRLRSWLIGIMKQVAAESARANAHAPRASPLRLSEVEAVTEGTTWEVQKRTAMLRAALERVRAREQVGERSIRAFEMVALGGMSGANVAEALGMTVEDVWAAKSRTLARVREELAAVEVEYSEEE